MEIFLIALVAVAVLLLQAVPGFAFAKLRIVGEDATKTLSKILMYFCQPCLAVYTFTSCEFSADTLADIGLFALAAVVINAVMLGAGALVLRRKFRDTGYRIITLAIAFSNSAFFGIPIIEAIMGEAAQSLIIYTTVYTTVMNIIGWAIGIAIITGDAKNISPRKMFINPAVLGVAVAAPLFILSINGTTVPALAPFFDAITVIGKMTTPLSMLIMGMRLAHTPPRTVFASPRVYAAVAVKGLVMPALAFALVYFLPVPAEVKQTFYIITACPTASVVLNFSELVGAGEREAASSVLLSTIFSILTLPVMMIFLKHLA